MNKPTADETEKSCCTAENTGNNCCQPESGYASSCCNPGGASWKKGKTIVSAIIIMAAIGVGAHSFVRVTSGQANNQGPPRSFSATLGEAPTIAAGNSYQGGPRKKSEEIPLNRVLHSLKALDTHAADRDVVFLVLHGQAQTPPVAIPKQVAIVANNLWKSGQRVGVFTLKSGTPDHNQLKRHFAVETFPCVVCLGRQGAASAVWGDINEARLYNAFVLASKPVSCCPAQSNASCCPK